MQALVVGIGVLIALLARALGGQSECGGFKGGCKRWVVWKQAEAKPRSAPCLTSRPGVPSSSTVGNVGELELACCTLRQNSFYGVLG